MRTLTFIILLFPCYSYTQNLSPYLADSTQLSRDSIPAFEFPWTVLFGMPLIQNSEAQIDIRFSEGSGFHRSGSLMRLFTTEKDKWKAERYEYEAWGLLPFDRKAKKVLCFFNSVSEQYEAHDPEKESSLDSLQRRSLITLYYKKHKLRIKGRKWEDLWSYFNERKLLSMRSHRAIDDSLTQAEIDSIDYAIEHNLDDNPLDNYDPRMDIIVFDGSNISVSIKIGQKFRSYSFGNPHPYSEIWPEINEFRYMSEIWSELLDSFTYKGKNRQPAYLRREKLKPIKNRKP